MTNPPKAHEYLSTACWHELNDGDPTLHGSCRATCKFCGQSCGCQNHPAEDAKPHQTSWVDQARDGFVRLLAVLAEHNIDLATAEPDLHEAVRYDPDWFWARGEVQPAGEWEPPDPLP